MIYIQISLKKLILNKNTFIISLLVILFNSNICVADTKYRYGLGVNNGTFNINDPSGSTEDKNTSFLSLMMTLPFNKNNKNIRWWLEGHYRSFDVPSSETLVGQEYSALGLNGLIQYSFNVSNLVRPWVGVGGGVNFSNYKNRKFTDSEGFTIGQEAPNRDETNLDFLLNLGLSLRKTDAGIFYGVNLVHHITLDNGVDGTRLTIFALF